MPLPNRLATYAAALAALCAAIVPVVADLDWTSTVGIIGGVGALSAVVWKWLDGWQKYEERVALEPILPENQPVQLPTEGGGTTLADKPHA